MPRKTHENDILRRQKTKSFHYNYNRVVGKWAIPLSFFLSRFVKLCQNCFHAIRLHRFSYAKHRPQMGLTKTHFTVNHIRLMCATRILLNLQLFWRNSNSVNLLTVPAASVVNLKRHSFHCIRTIRISRKFPTKQRKSKVINELARKTRQPNHIPPTRNLISN